MAASSRTRKVVIVVAASLIVLTAIILGVRKSIRMDTVGAITGTIIAQNSDLHLQRPIGNAKLIVSSGAASWQAVSEVSGLVRLRLDPPVPHGDILEIRVEHPDYLPFVITTAAVKDQLHIIRLSPARMTKEVPTGKQTLISNIRVRYATRAPSTNTIGSAVRILDVMNTGNVPCNGQPPCSPDGRWKAKVASLSLDSGENNKHFRNVRLSCIAGPCPFSRIDSDGFSKGGRSINVAVRNWSDPVTYLLEAEVALTMESELIRYTYPVTFGKSMNFTLPRVAQGPTIEAEMDTSEIVFPLGPELRLSWATCRFEAGADGTKQYQCELKPGYQFN